MVDLQRRISPQWSTDCGGIQDDPGNSDISALTNSDCSQKFSDVDSGENFIRLD
jgi:hypothetical protein